MHVSQICIYISNICKVHTCASYSTYVRFVPLGIYLCICDGMSEPSGPSGQRIGIHPPALKPGFDPLINMVRYERALCKWTTPSRLNGNK